MDQNRSLSLKHKLEGGWGGGGFFPASPQTPRRLNKTLKGGVMNMSRLFHVTRGGRGGIYAHQEIKGAPK